MGENATTSVRLPVGLKQPLDQTAARLQRGQSWIVAQALTEYLRRAREEDLAVEAREQLERVKRADQSEEESEWEALAMECWTER